MNIQKNNHAAHTKIEIENVLPTEIEKRSFEIITEELEQEGIIPVSYTHLAAGRDESDPVKADQRCRITGDRKW